MDGVDSEMVENAVSIRNMERHCTLFEAKKTGFEENIYLGKAFIQK